MSDFQIRSKTWLEVDGKPFLGDGRFRLLSAIQRNGSINAAAKDLVLSYRKAWAQLKAMEESSPFLLLERRTGGTGGGASLLTDETVELLKRFEKLRDQVNRKADQCFATCFAEESVHADA